MRQIATSAVDGCLVTSVPPGFGLMSRLQSAKFSSVQSRVGKVQDFALAEGRYVGLVARRKVIFRRDLYYSCIRAESEVARVDSIAVGGSSNLAYSYPIAANPTMARRRSSPA